jgi:alpha-N-arabinofuranosidase
MIDPASGKRTVFFLTVPISSLSTETAGGFTGVHVGPYATARGRVSDSQAVFTDFHYDGHTV